MRRQHLGDRPVERGRGVPADDRVARRHAGDADRKVGRAAVHQRGRDGAHRRLEPERRRAQQAPRRQPQLGQRPAHQFPLPAPREQERRVRFHPRDLPDQRQTRLAGDLSSRHQIRKHDDVAARRGGIGGRAGDARVEPVDRGRLQDVERLAFRDAPFRIDQPHLADPGPAGEGAGERPAEGAGADDRNGRHARPILFARGLC